MKPGRELDALVAEKVMGLVNCEKHKGSYCHAFPESPDKGGETKPYSTDIAAAWEVVEKMIGLGFTYEISFNVRWDCQFFLDGRTGNGQDDKHGAGNSETAPHAIALAALAALAAVGYEEGK